MSQTIKDASERQAKESARQAARNRVVLDLDPTLEAVLKLLANQSPSVPLSNLVAFLTVIGLHQLAEGKISLEWARHPTRALRFDQRLTLPPIPERYLRLLNGEPEPPPAEKSAADLLKDWRPR